jgi:hypothetical protein
MAVRIDNRPPGRLKNEYGEIDESMFQGAERPFVLVFFILGIEKKDDVA